MSNSSNLTATDEDGTPTRSLLHRAAKRKVPCSPQDVAGMEIGDLSENQMIELITAADNSATASVPSLKIPALPFASGTNGVSSIYSSTTTNIKAAQFPCQTSLAATWNKNLLYEVGQLLAQETRARSADILFAPNACLLRHPLGGSNSDFYSEDPFLTGKLASQCIKGIQDQNVASATHYFLGNEQEVTNELIDVIVTQRALHELYLRPFEIVIREANPWVIVPACTGVNGNWCSENTFLLRDILRKEWGYDGCLVSFYRDYKDTIQPLKAGCDLVFPQFASGPRSKARRCADISKALAENRISSEDIEQAAENLLRLVNRVKGNDMSEPGLAQAEDRPETRELIRRASQEGLTLLKNDDNLLPLCPLTTTVAVIGPNAGRAVTATGGSPDFDPYYYTIPLTSIRRRAKHEVLFVKGCAIDGWEPLESQVCTDKEGNKGVSIEWYKGDRLQPPPVVTEHNGDTNLYLWNHAPIDQVGMKWSARVTTFIKPPTTGIQTLGFMTAGPGQLFINGKLAVDFWNWTKEGQGAVWGSEMRAIKLQCEAGKAIKLEIRLSNEIRPEGLVPKVTHNIGGCRIGFKTKPEYIWHEEAARAAQSADVAVVIVGLDPEWEVEGKNRRNMDLPHQGSQDRLIETIAQANPRTIVINQSGGPVSMPWVDEVPAIIQAWYQGQEAGNALADVLFGLANPSGKLPITFPKRIEDTPGFLTWPGNNGQIIYGEDLYVGYKYYDKLKVEPLFPFGHGLSYTTFKYDDIQISSYFLKPRGSIKVALAISNTGNVAGAEIVQAYVHDEESRLQRPVKELAAFEKVFLEPGETKQVTFNLDKYSVGYYDSRIGWIAEKGWFQVLVGASSADIRCSAKFEVQKSFNW